MLSKRLMIVNFLFGKNVDSFHMKKFTDSPQNQPEAEEGENKTLSRPTLVPQNKTLSRPQNKHDEVIQ